MSQSTIDVAAVVRSWSPKQKQVALTTLVRDHVASNGHDMISIEDDEIGTVGYFMPATPPSRGEIIELDDSTPELRELRRRVETLEDSISMEEFIAREERLDAAAGRE